MPILSRNKKTGVSLNLPSTNCRPTSICKFCCYGRHHYLGHGRAALAKWQRNSDYLSQTTNCLELIQEARAFSAVRISGIGDLLPEHVNKLFILAQACPNTQFWGMTRKPEIAAAVMLQRIPNLKILVTVDATSPDTTWEYQGAMCYGPRRSQDKVPRDRRIVTVFPYHNSGKVVGSVPEHRLDCPAIRHTVSGCLECGRCWNWKH